MVKKLERVVPEKLGATLAAIDAEFDKEMEALRARRRESVNAAKRQARSVERAERKKAADNRRKMAFEIGEFVLAQGAGSAIYESVVASPEFDRFMGDARRQGRRKLFGLSE